MIDDLAVKTQKPLLTSLESELLKMPQAEVRMTHTFADGVYSRERWAPAGTLIIGKRHRHETMSFLMKGTLSVYNELGEETATHEAPKIWVSDVGSKRMTYSHTDTILVTVHPTNETDLEKIEHQFIIPEQEYLEQQNIERIGQ